MVAFAEIDTPETPSGPLSFGSAVAVAVEDDGAVADGLLLVARVCAEKQGRATFTGYVADNETSLLHARARQYSPTLGRFIGRDPWRASMSDLSQDVVSSGAASPGDGYPDGMSLYGLYEVQNSVDPAGLEYVKVDLGDGTVLVGNTTTGKFGIIVGKCTLLIFIYHGDPPKSPTNHKWIIPREPVIPRGPKVPVAGGLFIGCYPMANNPTIGRVGQRIPWEGLIETRDPDYQSVLNETFRLGGSAEKAAKGLCLPCCTSVKIKVYSPPKRFPKGGEGYPGGLPGFGYSEKTSYETGRVHWGGNGETPKEGVYWERDVPCP